MRSSVAVALLLGAGWVGSAGAAEGWNQWRGPQRDGTVAGFVVPDPWPKQLARLWSVEVGEGYASPVVAGDRAFVLGRQGEQEVVRAVSLADGRPLWSKRYDAPFKVNQWATSAGKGPKSTPIVTGGRLVTLGISGVLSCWETDSGRLLWQHEFSKRFPNTWPLYGAAMSPMIDDGMLIAHVGGSDQGSLTAFELETGRAKWFWNGDGPAYSSPVLLARDGTRQVITQSQNARVGVSATEGALLWKLPFTTQYDQNIVTPLCVGDLLIFSGLNASTTAYRLRVTAGKWSPEEVWRNEDVPMYTSSPVAVGQRLFGLTHRKKGQFFCLDAATGKTLWQSDGRMGDNAALLVAGDVVLALTTGGELIAFSAQAPRFEPLARYKVSGTPTWAHPVVLGRRILVKDQTTLALWSL